MLLGQPVKALGGLGLALGFGEAGFLGASGIGTGNARPIDTIQFTKLIMERYDRRPLTAVPPLPPP